MPASEELVGGIPVVVGLGMVAYAVNLGIHTSLTTEVLFYSGLFIMCLGTAIQATALEHFANFNNALGVTMEPWMNGKRTIYIGDVETVRHPYADSGGPEFRSKVNLVKPRFKHPLYGVQKYIYVDHDLEFWQRIRLRKGKGSYMDVTVKLRGVDGNVTLSEHPTPILDDFGPVPVYTMVRAGQDWKRENGDFSPMAKYAEAPLPGVVN